MRDCVAVKEAFESIIQGIAVDRSSKGLHIVKADIFEFSGDVGCDGGEQCDVLSL